MSKQTLVLEKTREEQLKLDWNQAAEELRVSVVFNRRDGRHILLGWLVGKGVDARIALGIAKGSPKNGWEV